MVVLFPHIVFIELNTNPVQDESGKFSVQEPGSGVTIKGKAVKARENDTITGQDGKTINYSFKITCPKQSTPFPYGSNVRITFPNGDQFNGYLKSQYNGQLRTFLWV